MTFFNQKEDVLDIKLTQFGKYLISKGKWNPTYYAFYDDDIIYDSEYAGYVETQNDIQPRITGSARTKTQYVFQGIETQIQSEMQLLRKRMGGEKDKLEIQPSSERNYALAAPMGTSDLGNPNFPAWQITALNGQITGSSPYATSSLGLVPIVSLETRTVNYVTSVKNKYDEDTQVMDLSNTLNQIGESAPDAKPSDLILANKIYDDGTYVDIQEDYLLFEMLEKNTLFQDENLEMEVFRYDTNVQTQEEILIPLKFMKKKQLIVDDILIDDDDPELNRQMDLSPDCVEYFFNVWVDDEIDEETLCKAVRIRKNLGLYTPPIKCPEEVGGMAFDGSKLYGPGLPGQADVEICTPEPPCPGEPQE